MSQTDDTLLPVATVPSPQSDTVMDWTLSLHAVEVEALTSRPWNMTILKQSLTGRFG